MNALRRELARASRPFGGALLSLGARLCALVATLSLAAIFVRSLPWMLDARVGWGTIAVFARGLIVVALETSLVIGLPLSAALVASSMCDRGECAACLLVGVPPARLAARCIPSSMALAIVPLVLAIAWGDVRPGVALSAMIDTARDACSATERPVSEVPVIGAAWLCAPGDPPVLALASRAIVRANSVSIADDLRTVSASGVRVDVAEPLALHLEVREAVFRGLPPVGRAKVIPGMLRAWLVSMTAILGAWAVMTTLLARLDARRWLAVALGASTSATMLLTLALVEKRAQAFASPVPISMLIPLAMLIPIATLMPSALVRWARWI